jgi:hypothetical protein
MKRVREEGVLELSSSSYVFESYASVIHAHVGKYLKDSIQDYISLALCCKKIWNYFCTNDSFIICMRFAWKHLNPCMRPTYLLYSNIPMCVRWIWNKESQNEVKEMLSLKYVTAGAKFGNLQIMCEYAPFLPPEVLFDSFGQVLNIFIDEKHEDAAITFINDPSLFHPQLRFGKEGWFSIYFLSVQGAINSPKFHAYMKKRIAEMNILPGETDSNYILLHLVAACTAQKSVKQQTFELFWKRNPYPHHAKRLLAYLIEQGDGSHIDNIPWIVSRFFTSFSYMQDETTQLINFEGGESFTLSKTPSSTEGEMDCKMTYTSAEGLVGRFRGNFPIKWC